MLSQLGLEGLDATPFHPDFRIAFYGAFRTDKDFYGQSIIENLYQICQSTGRGQFFTGAVKISTKGGHQYKMPI